MTDKLADIVRERFETGRGIRIDFDSLNRGIDNYRIDVKLSVRFSSEIRKLVRLLVSQYAVPNPEPFDQSTLYDKLRDKYQDLMMVLIHRVKTDLDADQIGLLQFAPLKYTIRYIRLQLDEEIRVVSARLADHRSRGSTEALATQHRLYWLKKNYDRILYQVSKLIFAQLQRVEERNLKSVRSQYLGEENDLIAGAITTPLHYTSELSALALLTNEFSVWSWNADDEDFCELNNNVEKLFKKHLGLDVSPLQDSDSKESTFSEIHDELGGLLKSQAFLGVATDTRTTIEEEFNWFDCPENISAIFDPNRNEELLQKVRKSRGMMAARRTRRELKKLNRFLAAFSRQLRADKLQTPMIASRTMRHSVNSIVLEHVDLKTLGQYLCGQLSLKKVQESITGSGFRLNQEQLKSLEDLRQTIKERVRNIDHNDLVKLLVDVSRYRQQLKFYRFAHRAFNRLNLLTSKDDIKLSESAGTLYKVPTSPEIEDDSARICHHAILKADVRGSTTVTDELENKGLNPASYFSTRFFNPINKILETYGANKVFIEGDAIILSFLEYENAPQQWFSVSRACGYARDMLKITSSNNRYSRQMGLPLLELGVGICYSGEAPRFLYDGDDPIMISGAIGLADRMSGCSWNLRAALEKGLFNVNVLQIADGEMGKGEKGQEFLRYNVNGITLDHDAFKKLKTEISLRSLRIKLNNNDYLFHVGEFPDAKGRKKDLVIREGKVGLWKDAQIQDNPEFDESYYEVVVNRRVLSLILEKTSTRPAAAAS